MSELAAPLKEALVVFMLSFNRAVSGTVVVRRVLLSSESKVWRYLLTSLSQSFVKKYEMSFPVSCRTGSVQSGGKWGNDGE